MTGKLDNISAQPITKRSYNPYTIRSHKKPVTIADKLLSRYAARVKLKQ